MKILKEFECSIDVAGEEVKCLVYVNAFYSVGPRFGFTETFLDDIEIDEILSLEDTPTGIIELKDVTNITRLTDYLYDKVLNDTFEIAEDTEDYDSDLKFYDELKEEWN